MIQRQVWMGMCAGWLALSCGGSQPTEPSTPEAPGAEPAPVTSDTGEPATAEDPASGETKKFDDMSHSDQVRYMKDVVLPEMKTLFQSVNQEHYADMSCPTCHGPGAKEGKFEMPTEALPKLTTTGKFEAEFKEHPEVTKFMMEQVVPKMAALLGEEPYNPETQQGFGCFDCHTAVQ